MTSGLKSLLSWLPVAYLIHDCVVECRYDPRQGRVIVVDKLSNHLGEAIARNDVAFYRDPTSRAKQLGRVIGLAKEWVTVDRERVITQIPKGHIGIEDDAGCRRIIPEAVVLGRLFQVGGRR